MKHMWVRGIKFTLLILGILLVLFAMSFLLNTGRRLVEGSIESLTEKPFYTLPNPLPEGKPGQLLRSEKLASVPSGMIGWRILYYSTDKDGKSIVVSGLVAAPTTETIAKRPVVSWGHPTTGIVERCAPSVGIDPFDSIEGLRDLVSAGYVVAATDYSGMGVSGPPSFLIGDTEGRNVLDAARAAQQLPVAHAGSNVTLWGHSQGGHAALFAEQLSSTYAPDLTIKGVAIAAPATDLGQLLDDDSGDVSGTTIGSYAMSSYSAAYQHNLNTILTPAGISATPEMARLCLLGQNEKLHDIAQPLIGKYFAKDPSLTEPWADMLKNNTPGHVKIEAPLFIAQGEIDTLVRPEVTQQFADTQKGMGASVTYVSLPNTGHGMVALKAMPTLLDWLRQQD